MTMEQRGYDIILSCTFDNTVEGFRADLWPDHLRDLLATFNAQDEFVVPVGARQITV